PKGLPHRQLNSTQPIVLIWKRKKISCANHTITNPSALQNTGKLLGRRLDSAQTPGKNAIALG
ncbi:MAG: hypothetical protein ACPGVO_19895, partial [Spirulinaceae cyanobacterium]